MDMTNTVLSITKPLTAMAFFLLAAAATAAAPLIVIRDLKVDYTVAPITVQSAAPQFSWGIDTVNATDRAVLATGYQLTVTKIAHDGVAEASPLWTTVRDYCTASMHSPLPSSAPFLLPPSRACHILLNLFCNIISAKLLLRTHGTALQPLTRRLFHRCLRCTHRDGSAGYGHEQCHHFHHLLRAAAHLRFRLHCCALHPRRRYRHQHLLNRSLFDG